MRSFGAFCLPFLPLLAAVILKYVFLDTKPDDLDLSEFFYNKYISNIWVNIIMFMSFLIGAAMKLDSEIISSGLKQAFYSSFIILLLTCLGITSGNIHIDPFIADIFALIISALGLGFTSILITNNHRRKAP